MAGFLFFHLSEKLFPDSPFKIHFLLHLLSDRTRFVTFDIKGKLIFGQAFMVISRKTQYHI